MVGFSQLLSPPNLIVFGYPGGWILNWPYSLQVL